jgi:hypothetical protein
MVPAACGLTTSLKGSASGVPPGPGRRYAVHFRPPGPGVTPLAPPLARTLGITRMTRPTNQQIEEHYFEQFRKHFALPAGEVRYDDKPDVRIIGERKLGIEIARLYRREGSDSTSEQVQRSKRKHVLARAQVIYTADHGRPIQLHVDFDPEQPITDVEQSAIALAKLALEHQHKPTQLSGCKSDNMMGIRYFQHSGEEYLDPRWMNIQGFEVPVVSPERIQEVVHDKNQKSVEYAVCDSLWLLLIVDFMDLAQDVDLSLSPDFRLKACAFERVLLYKPQFAKVVEVPVMPNPSLNLRANGKPPGAQSTAVQHALCAPGALPLAPG